MLHFISDAPEFVAREVIAFVPGAHIDWTWASDDAPAWANVLLDLPQGEDAIGVIYALGQLGYRVEGWLPKWHHTPGTALVPNPTFAMAAAAIDRTRTGGSSTPAPVYAQ